MIIFLIFVIFIILIISIFLGFLIYSFFSAGPYVRVPASDLESFFNYQLEGIGKKLIDLGSGDGQIVIAAAKKGYLASGIEINPMLLLLSKLRVIILRLSKTAKFELDNLWSINLSEYDYVTCFLFPGVRDKIIEKFNRESKIGAKLVFFKMGNGYEIIEKNKGDYNAGNFREAS
jgi:hypothetical protein